MDPGPLLQWLLTEGRLLTDPGALLDGLSPRLGAAGYPILRSNVQVRTLHPEVSMRLYAWRRHEVKAENLPSRSVLDNQFQLRVEGTVQEVVLDHTAFLNEAYFLSPFWPVTNEGRLVHCPITPDQREFAYPILPDLQRMGATDYLCVPLRFAEGPTSALSLTTNRPGGFDAAFLQALEVVTPAVALCMELHSSRHITRSLLHTYVGKDAGERVLAGQFHRGDVRRIEAALWFSDLRGFTAMSSHLSSSDLVATLNAYFTAVTGPLQARGGEILKYIGDAILAVFPVTADRDATAACAEALAAAHAACTSLDTLNRERATTGLPALGHGIGLHFGEAEYGNIGAPGRLDFTVIGRDVNLASRIEGLCGRLGQPVLASAEITRRLPDAAWRPLGTFELKGIAASQDVFGLAEST